jgi:hypothetical protein
MDFDQQNAPARLAAVVALVVAFVVFMVIVVSSLSGGGDSDEPARGQGAGQQKQAKQQPRSEEREFYVVKPGDCCLSQIASKTGVDVDTLIELNPNLDPQAIHSGDRVKLR